MGDAPASREEVDFAQLDVLPFGAILVDKEGVILFYNKHEETRMGMRRTSVLGKNFFTEVAPCAQVKDFYGRFRRAVTKTGVIASFKFHFPLPPRARDVHILMASFLHGTELLCLIIVGDLTD